MTQETPSDFAETWLQAKKQLRKYEEATQRGLWQDAIDASSELRSLSFGLKQYAQQRVAEQK
jgi:hypothetical protein